MKMYAFKGLIKVKTMAMGWTIFNSGDHGEGFQKTITMIVVGW